MDVKRWAMVTLGAAAIGWLAHPLVARSAEKDGQVSTRVVEVTAQCFVDTSTERRWCERRADVARLVDCTERENMLSCRMEYMQLMGRSGWSLVRVGGGTYREWWEAPIFFYERVTLHSGQPE